MKMLNRLFKDFLLLLCFAYNLSIADTPSGQKYNSTLKITSVVIKEYSQEDWQRISEFFINEENAGNRCVVRTDNTQRSGSYFIIGFNKFIKEIPEHAKLKISLIKDNSFVVHSYIFDLPENFNKITSEIYCGITNHVIDIKNILCWNVELVDSQNKILTSYKSQMWQDEKQNNEQFTMERSLIILKPDCMEKNLTGEVLKRFADANLRIISCKTIQLTDKLLKEHYAHLAHLPFFPEIVKFMSSSPVIVLILEGQNAIANIRKLLGQTDSRIAEKGTIRGDLGIDKMLNIAHASDSKESAEIEIKRFFSANEIF